MNADTLSYACGALGSGTDADSIEEGDIQSHEEQPTTFMVAYGLTGHLSTQQFARTAGKFGDNYRARVCASYFNRVHRPDVGRACPA